MPSSDALFKKIDGLTSFDVFDPKIIENPPEYEQNEIEASESIDASNKKLPFCPNTLENSNGRIIFCFIMQQQIRFRKNHNIDAPRQKARTHRNLVRLYGL